MYFLGEWCTRRLAGKRNRSKYDQCFPAILLKRCCTRHTVFILAPGCRKTGMSYQLTDGKYACIKAEEEGWGTAYSVRAARWYSRTVDRRRRRHGGGSLAESFGRGRCLSVPETSLLEGCELRRDRATTCWPRRRWRPVRRCCSSSSGELAATFPDRSRHFQAPRRLYIVSITSCVTDSQTDRQTDRQKSDLNSYGSTSCCISQWPGQWVWVCSFLTAHPPTVAKLQNRF